MDIDRQVEYLMQGTHYGDDTLKQKSGSSLKARPPKIDDQLYYL